MTFLSLILLILMSQGLPPMVGPLIPDNTAVVTGIVRRTDTSRPIPDAQVTLMKSGETAAQAMTHASVTDVNGRFTIRNAAGGDYRVIVQAEGYFKPADDTPSSTIVGKDIYVFEGQEVGGLIFEMTPGSTISGRVQSTDGERLPLAPVEALQPNYVSGRMTLQQVKSTLTDDLGEYRLFWLPPGDYYLRALYKASSAERPERYPPVFFPGVEDEQVAPLVSVTPAAEASAVDVRVSTTPIGGVNISGRITDSELTQREVTAVYVVPRDRTVTLGTDTADAFANEASDRADGQFLIRGVPAGEYNLFPVVKDDDDNLRTVRIPVTVEDKAIEGVIVALTPAVPLRGRVTLDGNPLGGSVTLTSRDGLPGVLLGASNTSATPAEARLTAPVDPLTGEFVFERVNPGLYSLRPTLSADVADAYIADLRQNEKSVFDSGISVGAEAPDAVELVIRTEGGTVSGTVFDSTLIRPLARATVALVPDGLRRRNLALYRTAVSLPDGTFNLTGVAPGSYKLYAWQAVTSGAWENDAFLRKYEDRSVPLVVGQAANRTGLQVIAR
jgi:hypothetical protein